MSASGHTTVELAVRTPVYESSLSHDPFTSETEDLRNEALALPPVDGGWCAWSYVGTCAFVVS
jgi:hypothetical protein